IFIALMLMVLSGGPWGPAALCAREDLVKMDLSDADKKLLLEAAPDSIEAHLLGKPAPVLDAPPSLSQPPGATPGLHRLSGGAETSGGDRAGDGRGRGL